MVDVAQRVFGATGRDIVWAVLDSGIDGTHPHFQRHRNLELPPPLRHEDFTALKGDGDPLSDPYGHGTHVAGIIAGEMTEADGPVSVDIRGRTEWGTTNPERLSVSAIGGMAPESKLVSLKVLDDDGRARVSTILHALEAIQEMNGYGRRIIVHGVNLSLNFDYEAEWFACGQSPLCQEVDRLVKSGVVVVVAAGNTGWSTQRTDARGAVRQSLGLSINDPGNAELAITVGSTHRDQPQAYGVSYFSSRGPTSDGRAKPDLVAPGERIVSCRSTQRQSEADAPEPPGLYREDSGTAMAAAHVSGVVAAFLSVRREGIGDPLAVKETFRQTAVDLRRHTDFQGRGLINLFHALQPTAEGGPAGPAPGLTAPRASPTTVVSERSAAPAAPDDKRTSRDKATPPKRHRAVSLFCSYSQLDLRLRQQFERSIAHLMQERRIEVWTDGQIVPGSDWRKDIDRELASAELIVLLVSPDFMQSPFIQKVELKQAIERHEAGKARVVPIVLRPVATLGILGSLEALPKKAKALTTWTNRDLAWVDVAKGIERALNALIGE
jgi:subtilisin family serine protease